MRNALAGNPKDFSARDDERDDAQRSGKRAGKRAGARKPKGWASRWLGLFRTKRRMALTGFLGFAALAGIGVPLNALYLQEGRHPAPLFHLSAPLADVPPTPPQRPAAIGQTKSAAVRADADKAETAKLETTKIEAARASEKPRDAISALLEGAGPQSAEPADKNVLYAQRALAKLGYALRADGVFGGTTRQAIEKFERDAGMPVKGELTPKILRRLAAKSGLARN